MHHHQGRRPRQGEIAVAAGVSISTVSRVLNNSEGISQTLRERVLAAAADLGYEARESTLTQIHLLMTTGTSSNDPFHTDIMNSIEATCREHDIRLTHTVIGFDTDKAQRETLLERIRQNITDGFIFMAVDDRILLEQAMGLTSQMVLLNAVHWNLQVDTLLPDNVIGPRLAVNYLTERGHRAILHATELKRSTIKSRFASYQAALQEAGIPYDPNLVLETALGPAWAYQRMKDFLATKYPPFSAVFCANDMSAMGVIRALQEANYRIPQDISIIGYDDIETAPFIVPPLTTIRIDRAALGRLAVQRLIERNAHHDLTPIHVELFSQLIERQSVAPLNEANMAD
ncbi:LacI family DNA-binding transcriptional regulator [Dictyobacter formicarum]|uniref:LacI family transcriptional regulator n=1 Tax=Dictyobacter formicarum TaxID=2778368 RepID=A0ABQ3VD82_9CHLR|nr:LacI family DNA-binding transcriptional regulator [Dictyobacter formicarum]GHO84044.1 LacI family transcriptional regulator [Dictyobacter formicarum]